MYNVYYTYNILYIYMVKKNIFLLLVRDNHDGVVGHVLGQDLGAVLQGGVEGGHGRQGPARHLAH